MKVQPILSTKERTSIVQRPRVVMRGSGHVLVSSAGELRI